MTQYQEQVVTENGSASRVTRRAWSPAQIVALIAGLVLVVMGGVALARTGVNLSNIPATHTTVAGLGFTSLSALVQLVVGVIILGGGAYPDTAKGTMGVFGVVLLAWGLIVAIDTTPFTTSWGYVHGNGIFYAVVGAILLLAAALSPVFTSRNQVVRRRGVVDSTGAAGPAAY